jgi:hypothetical protein
MAIVYGANYGRPTLDLNFAKNKSLIDTLTGRNLITFSRSSTATYVGADGLIKTAASGAARFDHNPSTGESLGLLVEEARTNNVISSENFGTGTLNSPAGLTVINNSAVAPNGSMTACLLQESALDEVRYLQSSTPNLWITSTKTATIYVKAAGRTRCIFGGGAGNSRANINVDLTNGTYIYSINVTYWSNVNFSVTSVGGGWWRLQVTGLSTRGADYLYVMPTTRTTEQIQPTAGAPSGNSYQGDGTSGIYVWGAQLETGSFPTSYIPTTGSTVTRAADVATVSNTGSSIFPTSAFTTVNTPFGTAGGGSTVKLVGPTIKRTAVYSGDLTQAQINALAEVNDNFWRWRVLGGDFGINYSTNGQVTIDWGDGTVETISGASSATHTFTNGGGYNEIGFRLDSGTYFRPRVYTTTHTSKLIAIGPTPETMKYIDGDALFRSCSNLEAFDATAVFGGNGGTTSFSSTWRDCSKLKNFPFVDSSNITNFSQSWFGCTSLTSFPLINTAAGTNFASAWYNCNSLTSFPLINTAACTNFSSAWDACSSLTSFPLIDTAAGTNFVATWRNCSNLTSFPLINTAAGTSFVYAWRNCTSLTSFPLLNTAAGTSFTDAWNGCTSLTDFPASFFDSWTGTPANNCFGSAWQSCSALTATSVENILNSIDTSGQSAPASNVNITIVYNAGTGTPSVATAITNLQSRGWTITLNGVLQ